MRHDYDAWMAIGRTHFSLYFASATSTPCFLRLRYVVDFPTFVDGSETSSFANSYAPATRENQFIFLPSRPIEAKIASFQAFSRCRNEPNCSPLQKYSVLQYLIAP